MKTRSFLIATTAALTLAAPASAQLLGGGLGRITGGLSQSVSGAIDGRLSSSVDRGIDRRSGRASAGASADGALGGTLDSVTGGNGVAASKSIRAEKRVSKSASVQADGPGTDDGRELASGVTGAARGVLAGVAGPATAGSTGGAASGGGNAAASGGLLGGSGALSGSAGGSASGAGTLDVGTLVRDAKGRAVGRVQAVRDDAQTVLVSVGDRVAELPAASLSADGEVAIAAMSRAEIKKIARAQEAPAQP